MSDYTFTRRSAIAAATFGALAISASACSTSSSSSSGSSSASGGQMVLWTWPEGFSKGVLDSIAKDFPKISLRQDVIGGDFKQKLSTALQAQSNLPAITGIKGEDIAFFSSQAKYFVDLNTLGAASKKSDYLAWKWEQATTTDGKQIGIPIDVGPTALFYRFDIFEKLGLPSDPATLEAAIKTWDDYFNLGVEMKKKDSQTFLIRNLDGVFTTLVQQSGSLFIDKSGKFIGGDQHIKSAWDTAVKAQALGINAGIQADTPDSQAAVAAGKLPADFGASWHLGDLMVDAPDSKGKWHVCAHPGTATNRGGSFLGIPAGTKNQKEAFEVILKILDSQNQILEYQDKGNFPANKGAFDSSVIKEPVEFLGGQVAGEIFASAAQTVRPLYEHPLDGTVSGPFFAELQLVESSNKDPEAAFSSALDQAKRLAEQNGLTV